MKHVKRRSHTVDCIDSDAIVNYIDSDATQKEYEARLKRLSYDGNKITAMMSIYNT